MSDKSEIFSISIQNTSLHFLIHNESFIQSQNEQWKKALHSHVYYEILFSLSDHNKLILENQEFRLNNNSFAIVNPYQNHGAFFECATKLVSIGFYYEKSRNSADKNSLYAILDKTLASKNNIGIADESLGTLILKIQELCNASNPLSEGLIITLLTHVLYKLISVLNREKDTLDIASINTLEKTYLPRGNAFNALCQINDTLNAKYMEDITPDLLSEKYYISTKQINRYIYSLYGQTFLQRRTKLRILAAQKRLINTNDSIAKISDAVGYNSINTFYSAFKSVCGMTPDRYRHSNYKLSSHDL